MAVKKVEKKSTEYVVLVSDGREGPFDIAGRYTTQGGNNAKKAAALDKGVDDAEKFFYVAVPASSFRPNQPKITISFPADSDDGDDDQEPDDDGDDGATPDPDPKPATEDSVVIDDIVGARGDMPPTADEVPPDDDGEPAEELFPNR